MGTQQVGHTPGKWRMSSLDPRCNKHESGYKVFMEDSGYVLVCGANQEANARLIAAAPALAEALQRALPMLSAHAATGCDCPDSEAYRLARAALVAAGIA